MVPAYAWGVTPRTTSWIQRTWSQAHRTQGEALGGRNKLVIRTKVRFESWSAIGLKGTYEYFLMPKTGIRILSHNTVTIRYWEIYSPMNNSRAPLCLAGEEAWPSYLSVPLSACLSLSRHGHCSLGFRDHRRLVTIIPFVTGNENVIQTPERT